MALSKKVANTIAVLVSVSVFFLSGSLFFVDEVLSLSESQNSEPELIEVIKAPEPQVKQMEEIIIEEAEEGKSDTLETKIQEIEEEAEIDLQGEVEIPEPVVEPQKYIPSPKKVLFEYVEVIEGCGPYFEGECLRVRTGPGTDYPVVSRLRNGMVLKVDGSVYRNGSTWYKIVFDEWLRYPERLTSSWYVSADYVEVLLNEGDKNVWDDEYSTTSIKTITVDRSEQMLYAFEGNYLYMAESISSGLALTPTPAGTFTIFKKTPSRYMQGPLPGMPEEDTYDLPGVPWNLYFTHDGAVIHGAYWHDNFGSQHSHGCVNLPLENADKLYHWADLGTKVIVKD